MGRVPLGALVLSVLRHQRVVSAADLLPATGPQRCELGVWHPGSGHAAQVWDWDGTPDVALWLRWPVNGDEGGSTFEVSAWCGAPSAGERGDGDACGLFAGHPAVHDWQQTDPELDAAVRRSYARDPGIAELLVGRGAEEPQP
ncbi:hypothetical protein ABT160_37545 [Streptomyces sp. NPDC001941]|uniref:hypothetical protein n=1 Tax=Streptomyces sp. NPDC001941 TaxID=3154659 RepID=UPI003332CD46